MHGRGKAGGRGSADRRGTSSRRARRARATPCRLTEITDGLSNTIFFGEVRPAWNGDTGGGGHGSCSGNGYTKTTVPINHYSGDISFTGSNGCSWIGSWTTAFGFKSCHPGGAHFVLGDGTVRFLPETVDFQAYQYLGNKADGQSFSMLW